MWAPATVAACGALLRGQQDNVVRDRVVVELGAGCGVASLVAALCGNARRVHITDSNDAWLHRARRTIRESDELRRLASDGVIHVRAYDWSSEAPADIRGAADVVLAVECVSLDVYGAASLRALARAVREVAKPGATLVLCSERRRGDGLDEFVGMLREAGISMSVDDGRALAVSAESAPLAPPRADGSVEVWVGRV